MPSSMAPILITELTRKVGSTIALLETGAPLYRQATCIQQLLSNQVLIMQALREVLTK